MQEMETADACDSVDANMFQFMYTHSDGAGEPAKVPFGFVWSYRDLIIDGNAPVAQILCCHPHCPDRSKHLLVRKSPAISLKRRASYQRKHFYMNNHIRRYHMPHVLEYLHPQSGCSVNTAVPVPAAAPFIPEDIADVSPQNIPTEEDESTLVTIERVWDMFHNQTEVAMLTSSETMLAHQEMFTKHPPCSCFIMYDKPSTLSILTMLKIETIMKQPWLVHAALPGLPSQMIAWRHVWSLCSLLPEDLIIPMDLGSDEKKSGKHYITTNKILSSLAAADGVADIHTLLPGGIGFRSDGSTDRHKRCRSAILDVLGLATFKTGDASLEADAFLPYWMKISMTHVKFRQWWLLIMHPFCNMSAHFDYKCTVR